MRTWIAAGVMTLALMGGLSWAADLSVVPGKQVSIDYTLTVDNEVIESSKGKAPLVFVFGAKNIIPGLETALKGMHVGEEKLVNVAPKDAYGEVDPKALKEFPLTTLPKTIVPKVGMVLQAQAPDGQSFPAAIHEVKKDSLVLDFNHPLAGKSLKFQVKVVKIENAPAPMTAAPPKAPVAK